MSQGAYHHGNLEETLIELAMRHLERNPPDRLSLRELARAAGVSPNAPYRHFRDREELLAAVVARGFEELEERFASVPESGMRLLLAFGEIYVAFAKERPWLFRLMFSGCASEPPPKKENSSFNLLLSTIRQVVPAESDDADVMQSAVALWCMAHGQATLTIEGALDKVQVNTDVATLAAAFTSIGFAARKP